MTDDFAACRNSIDDAHFLQAAFLVDKYLLGVYDVA